MDRLWGQTAQERQGYGTASHGLGELTIEVIRLRLRVAGHRKQFGGFGQQAVGVVVAVLVAKPCGASQIKGFVDDEGCWAVRLGLEWLREHLSARIDLTRLSHPTSLQR